MKYIEMYFFNSTIENKILINIKNKTISFNNVHNIIDDEKIQELIRIIRTWKSQYKADKINNEEKFIIKIVSLEGIETITGDGNYPSNYILLKEWLGEYYG